MTDYVTFECVHIADTDLKDSDENKALAYADIDGYPADENGQGTVICRVWLLREKDGIYPSYLVDWHDNRYRNNRQVTDLIAQVKTDLEQHKENMLDMVLDSAYERYKLKWMMDHGHTLDELLKHVQMEIKESTKTIADAVSCFENKIGFDGEIWVDKESFQAVEWEDLSYMQELLTDEEYKIWKTR